MPVHLATIAGDVFRGHGRLGGFALFLPLLLGIVQALAQLFFLVAQAGRFLVLLRGDGGVLVLGHLRDLGFLVLQILRQHSRLKARAAAGFIDQVDRFVRKIAVGDVAVGQLRGGRQARRRKTSPCGATRTFP